MSAAQYKKRGLRSSKRLTPAPKRRREKQPQCTTAEIHSILQESPGYMQ
jgi:hypothetical protein